MQTALSAEGQTTTSEIPSRTQATTSPGTASLVPFLSATTNLPTFGPGQSSSTTVPSSARLPASPRRRGDDIGPIIPGRTRSTGNSPDNVGPTPPHFDPSSPTSPSIGPLSLHPPATAQPSIGQQDPSDFSEPGQADPALPSVSATKPKAKGTVINDTRDTMGRLLTQICYGPNQAFYLAEVTRLLLWKVGPYAGFDREGHQRRLADLMGTVRERFRNPSAPAAPPRKTSNPPPLINDDNAPPITPQQTQGLADELRLIVSKVYAKYDEAQAPHRGKHTPTPTPIFEFINGFIGTCPEVTALRLRNFPNSLHQPLTAEFTASIETHIPGNYQFALRCPSSSPSEASGTIFPDEMSLSSHTFTPEDWAHSPTPSYPPVTLLHPSSTQAPPPMGPPPQPPARPLASPTGHPHINPPAAALRQPPLSSDIPFGAVAPPSRYLNEPAPLWLELKWAQAHQPEAIATFGQPPSWTDFLALHHPSSRALSTTPAATQVSPYHAAGDLSTPAHPSATGAHPSSQPLTHVHARASLEEFPTRDPSLPHGVLKSTSVRRPDKGPSTTRPPSLAVAPHTKSRKRKGSGAQPQSHQPRPHRHDGTWYPAPKTARFEVQSGVNTGHSCSSRDFPPPGNYQHTASFTSTPLVISQAPSPPAPTLARQKLYEYLQQRDLVMAQYPSLYTLNDQLADTPTSSRVTREVCIDQQTLGGCPHISSPYHDHPRPSGQQGFIRYYHYNMATLPHRHFPSTDVLLPHTTGAVTPTHETMTVSAVRDYEELTEATRFSHISATRVVNQHSRLQPGHFPQFSTHDDSDKDNTLRYEDTIPPQDVLRIPINLLALPSYSSARDRSWAILFRSRILKPPSVPAPFLPQHLHSPNTTYMRHDTDHAILRPFVVRSHPHSHLFNPTLRQTLDTLFAYLNADKTRPDHAAEFLADILLYRERNSNPFLAHLRAEAPLLAIPHTNITGDWPSPESSDNTTADRESYPVGLQFLLTTLATKHDLRCTLPTDMLLSAETLSFHCQRILNEGPHAPAQVSAGMDFLGTPGPTPRPIPYNVDDPRLKPSHHHYMDLQPIQLTEMYNRRRKRYYEVRTGTCPAHGADDDTVVSAQPDSLPTDYPPALRAQYQINHDAMNKLPPVADSLFKRREQLYDRLHPDNVLHPSFGKSVSWQAYPPEKTKPEWLPPQQPASMDDSQAESPTDSDSQEEADYESDSPEAADLWGIHPRAVDNSPRGGALPDDDYQVTHPDEVHQQTGADDEGDLVSGLTASDGGGPERTNYPTTGPYVWQTIPEGINVSREFYHLTRSWGHCPPYRFLEQADQRRLTELLNCLHSQGDAIRTHTQVKLLEDLYAVAPANALSLIREEPYWITPRQPYDPIQTRLATAIVWNNPQDIHEDIFRLSHIRLLSPQDPLIVQLKQSTANKLLRKIYHCFDRIALSSTHRSLRPRLRHFGWDIFLDPQTQEGLIRWIGFDHTIVGASARTQPTWIPGPPNTWIPTPGRSLSPSTPLHHPPPPTPHSPTTRTAPDTSTFISTTIPHTPSSHPPNSMEGAIPHPPSGFYRNPVLSSVAPVSSLPCQPVAPQSVTTHHPVIGAATTLAGSHDAPASTTPPSQA